MDDKWYKFSVSISGFIKSSSPERVDRLLTAHLKSWNECGEIDVVDMLVDELFEDEE